LSWYRARRPAGDPGASREAPQQQISVRYDIGSFLPAIWPSSSRNGRPAASRSALPGRDPV